MGGRESKGLVGFLHFCVHGGYGMATRGASSGWCHRTIQTRVRVNDKKWILTLESVSGMLILYINYFKITN